MDLAISKRTTSSVINITAQDLYGLNHFIEDSSVIGIGTFDGVHLGHQEIIKNCIYAANALDVLPIIISFAPHPVSVIKPNSYKGLITTPQEKSRKILGLGIKKIINLVFDKDMANISDEEFIYLIAKKFSPKKIITGDNFFYGYKKNGNAEKLTKLSQKIGFAYSAIKQVFYDNAPLSSSLVRAALNQGFIEKVNVLLGSKYVLSGRVISGKKVAGSMLGCPTANIAWPDDLFKIKFGVYLSSVLVGDRPYFGLANIGIKPTVSNAQEPIIEAHLLDFEGELYDQVIKLELLSFLRPERRFTDLDMLKLQITNDIKLAKHLIKFGSFKD